MVMAQLFHVKRGTACRHACSRLRLLDARGQDLAPAHFAAVLVVGLVAPSAWLAVAKPERFGRRVGWKEIGVRSKDRRIKSGGHENLDCFVTVTERSVAQFHCDFRIRDSLSPCDGIG